MCCLLLPVSASLAFRSVTSSALVGHAIPQARSDPAPANARVLALFIDHSGRLVAGPSKGDLLVKLGGKPAQVEETQSLRNQPLIFSVVVDESGSTRDSADLQTNAAIRLFCALSTGSNRGFLVEFNEDIYASDQFVDASTAEQQLRKAPHRGSTKLYDALIAAATRQLQSNSVPPNSRHAIFAFSDGQDNSSMRSLLQAVNILQRAGTPVYPIKLLWNQESRRSNKQSSEALIKLSESTGGQVVLPKDANGLLDQMPSILEGQYLITFMTAGLKSNKAYSFKISLPGKDVQALAQSEYIAP